MINISSVSGHTCQDKNTSNRKSLGTGILDKKPTFYRTVKPVWYKDFEG